MLFAWRRQQLTLLDAPSPQSGNETCAHHQRPSRNRMHFAQRYRDHRSRQRLRCCHRKRSRGRRHRRRLVLRRRRLARRPDRRDRSAGRVPHCARDDARGRHGPGRRARLHRYPGAFDRALHDGRREGDLHDHAGDHHGDSRRGVVARANERQAAGGRNRYSRPASPVRIHRTRRLLEVARSSW